MRYLFLCIMAIMTLEAQSKVALVIGNQNYSSQTQLKNPINDAKLIKKTLESLNFKVLEAYDADINKLDRQISSFSTEASNADVAVLFYAGHGIGVDGKNYAIPVDTHNLSKENLPRKLISLNELQTTVSKASKFGVVFFDACRNSFFTQNIQGLESSRGSRALVRPTVRNNRNILVSFSTQAGTLAKDDVDGNKHSPYALALSEKLKEQKDIRLVMGGVKDRVQKLTNNAQEPINRSSLGGDEFLLNSKSLIQKKDIVNTILINNLMWQDDPYIKKEEEAYLGAGQEYGKVLNWDNAIKYCKNLRLGGFTDWKLPSEDSLLTLYNNRFKLKHIAFFDYWSATTYKKEPGHKWVFNFSDGRQDECPTRYSNYVRCVRDIR